MNSTYTEAPFLNMNLSVGDGVVSAEVYDKQDDFRFWCIKSRVVSCQSEETSASGCFWSRILLGFGL